MRNTRTEGANRHLADNLRALRERKGMSQPALAAAMNEHGIQWHQQTVARIESGQQRAKWDEVVALGVILGVAMERFTWPPAESNAADHLYMEAGRIRGSARDLMHAVGAFLSARSMAGRARESTAKYDSPRVRDAREELEDALRDYELVDVVNEGIRQYEELKHGSDDEGGDDGGDAEGEPGLVDQREA